MGNQLSVKKNKVIDKRKSFTSTTKTATTSVARSFNNKSNLQLEIYPNSVTEANRQRGEHYLLKYLFQTCYFAPIKDVLLKPDSKTLDIGCGSQANWLIDIARDLHESTFFGFDIIDPFDCTNEKEEPRLHIPQNCIITKHNLFEGFPYEDGTFDYVHQRMMHLIYHSEKVPWMFQEMLRVTKDDGYIELVEPDTMPKKIGPLFKKIFSGVRSLQKDHLGEMLEGNTLVKRMTEAGIVDIKSDYCSIPVCWGGYIGKLMYEDLLVLFQHLGPILFDYLDLGENYNKELLDEYLDKAFNECVEYQTFINVHWAYGRKPPPPSIVDNKITA